MRGEDRTSGALFSYVDIEARIGANHPLRAMQRLINAALADLDARFCALYEGIGCPVHPAGAPFARFTSAASLFDPLGAAAGRAALSSTCCFAGWSGSRSTRGRSTPRPF